MNTEAKSYADDWSDFESDDPGPVSGEHKHDATPMHRETCPRCTGTGKYHGFSRLGHKCLKCNGVGFLLFKKSAAEREAARLKAVGRKAVKQEANLARVSENYPDLAAWWKDSKFEFAVSLMQAARDFGALSENQVRAARRCIEGTKQRAEARAHAEKTAATVSIQPILDVFSRAVRNGFKTPKIRLWADPDTKVILSLAGPASVNAGAIYVKEVSTGAYLGKIAKNATVFVQHFGVTKEQHDGVIKALAAPLEAAKMFGHKTGSCSCCGRPLTNPASIEAGIGPICEGNYF